MRVLIAGATGQTGRHLTQILADQGHHPIAMVRDGSDTSVLPQGCETRQADLTNLADDTAKDVDAVIFAAGSGGDTSDELTDKVDRDGAKALIDRTRAAGVDRFVMLSSKGADDPDQGPKSLHHYLEAKHEADEHLKTSGLGWTIVRPVALTTDEATGSIELSSDHVSGKKISRADVATVLAQTVLSPATEGKVFEIANGGTPIPKALGAL